MELCVLGSTGYHPNQHRHTACLMIPEMGIVLDAGTGMFRVREHLATRELSIFLTHAHLDHVVGLTFLFDVLYGKDVERTTVYGEPAKLAAIRQHLFSELIFPATPPCEFRPLVQPVDLPDKGRLQFFPLVHPGGVLGFRLDWPDHSLAYVTDTTAAVDAPYVEHLRGVNLLVHECYFADEHARLARRTGHSHITPVAQVAAAAGVGRLVLVHLNPLIDQADPVGLETARKIFRDVELAHDGARYSF